MISVIIATEDQSLGQELQRTVLEVEGATVAMIASTSAELRNALLRLDADVAIVNEDIGPEPALEIIRDLAVRRPATAMLLASTSADADTVTAAMESGARGIVALPATYGQLEARLTAAAAWSEQMRRILAHSALGAGHDTDGGRGRLIGIAGAKGGVGTTTVVTHTALDIARSVPGVSVCLVDLDLEKGDVPGHLEVRHRLGISDLARVADDLSPGTVSDAMTQHESGVDILLAPVDIRDVEQVTLPALRQIMAALRRQYDLVLVDLGAHATPAQATVVELCDEVVLVVNPDVASMRGMRRLINAWESLAVCKESELSVLLNRTSKQVTVSMETVRQLTKATVLPTGLPAGFRRLEPALNSRDPLAVNSPTWWAGLRSMGQEIAMLPGSTPTPGPSVAGVEAATTRRSTRDRGSITLENIGILPLVAFVGLLMWHLAMFGATAALQSHAAATATRAASIGQDAEHAAKQSLPSAFRDQVAVTRDHQGLHVSMRIPAVIDGIPGVPTTLTTTRQVVNEP